MRAIALFVAVLAQDVPAQPEAEASFSLPARRALIVCGHPGDETHREMYAQTVERLRDALESQYRFATSEIRILFGTATGLGDEPALADCVGAATGEAIRAEAARLCARASPEDAVWVIVIGHAHFDGRQVYFNLPGGDISVDAFGNLFDSLQAGEQVFWLTTCLSGFAVKPISRKGRIVIAATRANLENNETVFPLGLADVLTASLSADDDRDGDGRLTIFDLYIHVVRAVMLRYKAAGSIPTEHAQLDDNGDGRGAELQIDYLEPELGGRAGLSRLAKVRPGRDGALSAATSLYRNSAIRVEPSRDGGVPARPQ